MKCPYCKNNRKKCKHIMAYAIFALSQALNYYYALYQAQIQLINKEYDCENFFLKSECYGCKNLNKYEDERELGYNSPCTSCKRLAQDFYEEEK